MFLIKTNSAHTFYEILNKGQRSCKFVRKRLDFFVMMCYTVQRKRELCPGIARRTVMKKILLTGFEPFGDDTRNPSGEAVSALFPPNEYEVKKLILPVSWKRAFPMIEKVWDEWKPDALLMLGLAAGAKTLRIERVGINLCGTTKDIDQLYACDAEKPHEVPVISSAPTAYFTTYNASAVLSALKEAEIPAKYSYSAGTYICNFLLYSALCKCETEQSDMQIGFIHLPYAEGQREDFPALPLETMTRALEIALCHLWK